MKLAAIVQARLSSQRLPGKVLQSIQGKPLLAYLVERLKRSETLRQFIVATSTDPSDNPIADFCKKESVECFRGALDNVADRFRAACEHYQLSAFVRVNADSPLLDIHLVDAAVAQFQSQTPDLVTNVQERTFPKGQSVEVVRVQAFQRALQQMSEPSHYEHVTRYMYEHPEDFVIKDFKSGGHYNAIQLSVDTPEDLATIKGVIERMTKPHWNYTWNELLPLYKQTTAAHPTR